MPSNPAPASLPRTFAAAAAAALAFGLASPAPAADFFAGKSIDLLIGAPPAGGYDIYARSLGRHLGRHIPGNPTIVAKNMPGAGSARAGGFISAIAPKDGTAIAALMPGAIIGQLLDPKAEALFDPTKVIYLGTANNGTRVCVSRKEFEGEDLRRRADRESTFRRRFGERLDTRLRLSAQAHGRCAIQRGARICRHRRHRAGAGTRRDRRRLRLGLGKLQVAAARLAPGQEGQCAAAGRPRAERRTHPDGRTVGVEVREDRRGPQDCGTGDRPAGLPAPLCGRHPERRPNRSQLCGRLSTPP